MLLRNTVNKPETLFNSVLEKKNTNDFTIITGYIGVSMAKELIKLSSHYDKIEVVVGMYGGILDSRRFNVLTSIQEQYSNINFYVTKKQIHSKLYIWHNDKNIESYLIGSANFSKNALLHNPQREVLELGNSFNDIAHYLSVIKNKKRELSIEQKSLSKITTAPIAITPEELSAFSLLSSARSKVNILGISVQTGEPHGAAGLNWGFSWAGPALNDAYIPIPIYKVRENYIPAKDGGKKVIFDAIWDDNHVMPISFEGNQGDSTGFGDFPKQISSFPNKHLMGDYLRKRISKKIGIDLEITEEESDFRKSFYGDYYIPYKNKYGSIDDHEKIIFFKDYANNEGQIDIYNSIKRKFITMNHLNLYGRNDITITTMGDDTYFLDFSV